MELERERDVSAFPNDLNDLDKERKYNKKGTRR